jgi:hypothetical protein
LKVLANRVLRRIFRFEKKEVVGGWRRLHNEELHNLYTSLNIIRVVKLRRMRWVGHVAHIEMRNVYTISVWKADRKRPLGKTNYRWKDNILMDLKKQVGRMWTVFIWLRKWTSWGRGGCSEHENELSGSNREEKFLDKLSEYSLLKKGFVPRKKLGKITSNDRIIMSYGLRIM